MANDPSHTFNVVYITPRPPYPLTSGMAIRQFHLLRAYARSARVQLVTFCTNEAEAAAARALEEHCDRVHVVPGDTMVGQSLDRAPRVWRVVNRLRGRRPEVVTWSSSPDLTRLVHELADDADVVHVARLPMIFASGPLLSRRDRPAMVLDLDDVESTSRWRQLRCGSGEPLLHRLYGYYDLVRLWSYQASAVRRFDRVFVCSERDRRRFGRSNVIVVPNGTSVPSSSPPVSPADSRTIMFCGHLSYGPNVDGLRFLVRSIFPAIRRAVPGARLVIVGRSPTAEVRAMHDGNAIVVAADVPSVTEYYAGAAVVAVPLRFGGGTRIKILEAWAHGVPVISTSIGCEGLDGVQDQHLMIADTPEDFAARCVALLRSSDVRRRLAAEAWRLVSGRYRWDDVGMRAVSAVEAVVHDRAAARTTAAEGTLIQTPTPKGSGAMPRAHK